MTALADKTPSTFSMPSKVPLLDELADPRVSRTPDVLVTADHAVTQEFLSQIHR